MKKLLFICFLFIFSVSIFAKEHYVGYSYKIFAAEGCEVKYSLSKQNEQYNLIVRVTSDRMLFTSNPEIKIRTFDNEVIELHGVVLGNGSSSVGVVVGSMVLPVTDIVTTAQFIVDESTLNILKAGVKKIRIVLSPMNHEREFSMIR